MSWKIFIPLCLWPLFLIWRQPLEALAEGSSGLNRFAASAKDLLWDSPAEAARNFLSGPGDVGLIVVTALGVALLILLIRSLLRGFGGQARLWGFAMLSGCALFAPSLLEALQRTLRDGGGRIF